MTRPETGNSLKNRFIIWRQASRLERAPLPSILSKFPDVSVLSADDPDSAVVIMDANAAEHLRSELPDCFVEPDVAFRLAR